MRTPLFLQADRRETTGTATTVLRVPASPFALNGQTLALLLFEGIVWLWALVSVPSPVIAAEAESVTVEREVHALVNEHRQAMGLRSFAYDAEIARQARRHSHRAEVSQQLSRQRERQMRHFKSAGQAQRFLAAHGPINNLFRCGRHLMRFALYRVFRAQAFVTWREVTGLPLAV